MRIRVAEPAESARVRLGKVRAKYIYVCACMHMDLHTRTT